MHFYREEGLGCSKPASTITAKNLGHVVLLCVLRSIPQCSYSHVFQIPSHGALQEIFWPSAMRHPCSRYQMCEHALLMLASPAEHLGTVSSRNLPFFLQWLSSVACPISEGIGKVTRCLKKK